ncbi:MAG: hypothetical protein LBB43_02575 [Spirochaetaceae bacterium]|jgi:hypothetical protein|nr:hypothetical protein [Spirochaetaceae bacterium]
MKKTLFLAAGILFTAMLVAAQTPLVIDYSYDISGKGTAKTNFLTFTGPQRFGVATQDTYDAKTKASLQKTTALFTTAYQTDIAGGVAFPDAVRGMLLFAVADDTVRKNAGLLIEKAKDGTISVYYANRGTAYLIRTNNKGQLGFPKGTYQKRVIGYVDAKNVQVISVDYTDGKATTGDKINWPKVWDAKDTGGKAIAGAPATVKTTNIIDDWPTSALFHFQGSLTLAFDKNILTVKGSLTPGQGAPK